ncbi:MAG TPA: DUF6328 family protein [Labilithrix sp.]|nr:DUF6328 family protein [Labilithrix sp.]
MTMVASESDCASPDGKHDRPGGEEREQAKLTELLNETRILLPGTEVFLGFLATMPFTQRFVSLDTTRRWVFICTFCSTVLSLVLFVVPAAYHRIARPIRHKERFKTFANGFLIAGLVPMSLSIVLATYLVTYLVLDGVSLYIAGALATLVLIVWWTVPLLRLHDHYPSRQEQDDEPPPAATNERSASAPSAANAANATSAANAVGGGEAAQPTGAGS